MVLRLLTLELTFIGMVELQTAAKHFIKQHVRRMRSSLDVNALTCLSKDDFWVLTAIEMAMRNIMESNRQRREDHSRVTRTPDVIMHVLRLQRRQTLAFVERPPRRGNGESEDDDNKGEAYIKVF